MSTPEPPSWLLLDTTWLVRIGRGQQPARDWVTSQIISGSRLACTTVNVTEIYSRAHDHELPFWAEAFASIATWLATFEDAVEAGRRRYALARLGFQMSLTDATIAAVARRMGATVVTDNVKDFELLEIPVLRPA